ncbi:thiamine monophosphate kinase [Neisseria arctica]|uniref:Thiamine-monophosphate kinase n=1 Tax=Neisseria arctica TaxID=1470200 RepID=A0A0J0YQS8_9NEIS|nr:thiamine-phosphate kinase [Neisseria arctica]KLT72486.1 thiamine monophosphate kinase [Neisseria arctica]UOO86388.1 thiamine-phosphate kinase [Neisseria arctica]
MKEFDFIRQYLLRRANDPEVLLGIGDDAAIVRPRPGFDLCFSSDMLLAGRHFFEDVDPADLAYKILAVNISDMAAMGAKPRWVLLSAALPVLDENWLGAFCNSLFHLAEEFNITLIGGDTTKGSYVFNVSIIGELPQNQALKRSGTKVGDDIWVSGHLGLAAAALNHHWEKIVLPPEVFKVCEQVRLRPIPRVALGQSLLSVASAAQDVSDGLAQDIGHILKASGVGAHIFADAIPTFSLLKDSVPPAVLYEYILAGGDDYELVFCAPQNKRDDVMAAARKSNTQVTCIGKITEGCNLLITDANGQVVVLDSLGFDHFG